MADEIYDKVQFELEAPFYAFGQGNSHCYIDLSGCTGRIQLADGNYGTIELTGHAQLWADEDFRLIPVESN